MDDASIEAANDGDDGDDDDDDDECFPDIEFWFRRNELIWENEFNPIWFNMLIYLMLIADLQMLCQEEMIQLLS